MGLSKKDARSREQKKKEEQGIKVIHSFSSSSSRSTLSLIPSPHFQIETTKGGVRNDMFLSGRFWSWLEIASSVQVVKKAPKTQIQCTVCKSMFIESMPVILRDHGEHYLLSLSKWRAETLRLFAILQLRNMRNSRLPLNASLVLLSPPRPLFSHRYYSLPFRIVLFGCIIRLFPLRSLAFRSWEIALYHVNTLS